MSGDASRIPVGRCGACGGLVSVPKVWMSTKRAVPQCESCGRAKDEAAGLPTVPMVSASDKKMER